MDKSVTESIMKHNGLQFFRHYYLLNEEDAEECYKIFKKSERPPFGQVEIGKISTIKYWCNCGENCLEDNNNKMKKICRTNNGENAKIFFTYSKFCLDVTE